MAPSGRAWRRHPVGIHALARPTRSGEPATAGRGVISMVTLAAVYSPVGKGVEDGSARAVAACPVDLHHDRGSGRAEPGVAVDRRAGERRAAAQPRAGTRCDRRNTAGTSDGDGERFSQERLQRNPSVPERSSPLRTRTGESAVIAAGPHGLRGRETFRA